MAPSVKRKRDEEFPLSREDATQQPVASSLIRTTEEVSFPRGGGSALTPLELKQVANEAANDVLFGKEKSSDEPAKPLKKQKKTTKGKKADSDDEAEGESEEKQLLVHHISFKTLKVGSLVLGQVSEISRSDLRVSFADGLSGFVNMAHISDKFTSILEDLDQNMEEDEENKKNDEYDSSDDEKEDKVTELPDLNNYFKLGQWLRCSVVSNTALEPKMKKNKKKRIELTIEPSVVNTFSEDDLDKFSSVQCSVKSIEDHGAILDLGVEGTTGFISKTDVPSFTEILPGSVFLGNITKKSGRSVNINLKFSGKKNKVTKISSVDAIIPGQVVDLLCDRISQSGISGKVFGVVPGFISSSHLRVFKEEELKHKFAIGSNVQCRITASLLNKDGEKTLILSTLSSIQSLEGNLKLKEALNAFPVGYIFDTTKVLGRDADFLYLALNDELIGRVHKSKVGELDSTDNLKARVLGYDSIDNIYEMATDPDTIKLKYIRASDIPIGELLTNCEITTVSNSGIELKIFGGQFTANVPTLHISDIRLVYPERKFKIGSKVKGRVLAVDHRGHIFVTLKKSIVNLEDGEVPLISSFKMAESVREKNEKTVATVQTFRPTGCIISFFGGIRGFLPNAEISEVYVTKPEQHLRLGQTVSVKILKVDEENSRILATCKVSNGKAIEQKQKIEEITLGRSIVKVTIVEKTKDSLIVEIPEIGLRGVIYVGHLSDDRIEQNRAAIKKVIVGSEVEGLVIDKDTRTQVFNLTLKKSLIKDAQKGALPLTYDDIKALPKTTLLHGYVKSVSDKGVFVAFNGKFVGLVLPSYAVESRDVDISKTFYVNQSIKAHVLKVDDVNSRFLLTLRDSTESEKTKKSEQEEEFKPVDSAIKNISDFTVNKIISCKIKSIKKNQLNVILADNVHGRVDVSEVFDKLGDISDKKQPLSTFKKGSIIKAKIIGNHDIKSHKFLPISHQVSKGSVLELSMKPSAIKNSKFIPLTIKDVKVDDELIGYVNNHSNNMLWLTISPTLKARISIFDLTENDTSLTENIEDNFPLGSAIPIKVSEIDTEHGVVIVTTRSHSEMDINNLKVNDKVPVRVSKIFDNYLILDLGNKVNGISFVTDALDDFSVSLKDTFKDSIHKIVPATILSVDAENKKINLSLRTEEAKTPLIKSHKDIKQGDIVHGLVKRVTDKGIFVYLSRNLEAFIPVSKLSDSYLKEWKKFYKPMQHVIGKVVQCDSDARILVTLRESEVNGDVKVLKSYDDIKVGAIFDGSVKNVTDFGVFVKLDNTVNVTGLAHISEIADKQPEDITALFGTGDRVKAIVLKVSPAKKQLSLSLKASHFTNKDSEESKEDEEVMEDVKFEDDASDSDVDMEDNDEEVNSAKKPVLSMSTDGLSLSTGFDWTASILDQAIDSEESELDEEDFTESKKHKHNRRRVKIVEDKTIDINTRAPESIADFERLIIGNPNSSVIWMNYMAFQLQLSEIDKAREISERALKTINFRQEAEKLNIWIAMLNLENTFGTSETLDDTFKRACQYMDSFTIHNKLLSIYQMSDKLGAAAHLFKIAAKKFGSEKVSVWVAWGDFLISNNNTEEVTGILSNALKALPKRDHVEVVRKFAQLEFAKGEPERARSLFEGLIADAGKRIDLWNVYIDQEIKTKEKKKVEDLFERVILKKLTKKQAKFFFNKWLEFEEAQDDVKVSEYVKAKAAEYVEKNFSSDE